MLLPGIFVAIILNLIIIALVGLAKANDNRKK